MDCYSYTVSTLVYILFLFFSYEFILIDAEFLVLGTFICFVFSLLEAIRGSVFFFLLDYSRTCMFHFFKFLFFFIKNVSLLGKDSWVSFFFYLSSFRSLYSVLQHTLNFFSRVLVEEFYIYIHFNFFLSIKAFFELVLKVLGLKLNSLLYRIGFCFYNRPFLFFRGRFIMLLGGSFFSDPAVGEWEGEWVHEARKPQKSRFL